MRVHSTPAAAPQKTPPAAPALAIRAQTLHRADSFERPASASVARPNLAPAGLPLRSSVPSLPVNRLLAGGGGGGPQNPPIGPNPAIDDPGFQVHHTPAHNPNDSYTGCLGYIHDMPQFRSTIERFANGGYLKAGNIPVNSQEPRPGELMIWPPNTQSDVIGNSASDGHVAYVEQVQANYDPPGDPNGRLVSYTITVSEANANGSGNDDRTTRTFTVPVDANGQPILPPGAGFYDPALDPANGSSAASTPGGSGPVTDTPSTPAGGPIPRGSTYQVQAGDTLTSIALRAGVTVDDLVRANPSLAQNPDFIREGQVLRIP